MKLHGLALELANPKHSSNFELRGTAITINSDNRAQREVLSNLSFRENLNLNSLPSIDRSFSTITKVLAGLVALQAVAARFTRRAPAPVALLLGSRDDCRADLENLYATALRPLDSSVTNFAQRSQNLKLLEKIIPQLFIERAQSLEPASTGYQEKLRQHYESGKDPQNKRILQLKVRFENNKLGALEDLVAVATERAKTYAKFCVSAIRDNKELLVFKEKTPWPDYANRPDLQDKYPIYTFATWHPAIKAAFVDTIKAELAIKTNIYFKPGCETDESYFLDLLSIMIWDQMDLKSGTLDSKDIPTAFNEKSQLKIKSDLVAAQTPTQDVALLHN